MYAHKILPPTILSHKIASISSFILQGHNISNLNFIESCCLKNSLGMRIIEIPYIKYSTAPTAKVKQRGKLPV